MFGNDFGNSLVIRSVIFCDKFDYMFGKKLCIDLGNYVGSMCCDDVCDDVGSCFVRLFCIKFGNCLVKLVGNNVGDSALVMTCVISCVMIKVIFVDIDMHDCVMSW